MIEIGNKNTLCFVIGDKSEGELQEVDIWASNNLLTSVDNMAYLPQFIFSLQNEKAVIESGEIDDNYIYFSLGPTTDDASGNITISNNIAKLSFDINGINCSTSLTVGELLLIYSETIKHLQGIYA